MTYTSITDEEGVKDAFLRLQTLFYDVEGDKEFPRHPKLNLSGEIQEAPKDGYNRYIIQFWDGEGPPKFMANVRPKRRDQYSSKGVRGLFVKDERGHRFLTHDGRFYKVKDSGKKFRQFFNSGLWIDVERESKPRFVVAQIDDTSAPDLVQQIRDVLDVVLDFKKMAASGHAL